jgi:hypothetical protein
VHSWVDTQQSLTFPATMNLTTLSIQAGQL